MQRPDRRASSEALDAHVHTGLREFLLGAAILLGALAAVDLARQETPAHLVSAVEAGGAALLLALALLRGAGRLPARAAQPIVAGSFLYAITAIAVAARLDPDRSLLLFVVLLPILASVFLLSRAWLAPVVGSSLVVQLTALAPLMVEWTLQARVGAALMTVVAPLGILHARLRTHRALQRALESARDGAERYRRVFASSPVPKWVYDDATLQILDVNEAAVRAYGHPRERFLAMRFIDVWHPEDVQRRLVDRAGEDRSAVRRFDARHVRADGSVMHVIVTAAPLPHGERATLMATAIDITDQVRAAEALRVSDLRFRSLARATNDVVWDWDLVTDGVWWNENFFSTFGYRPEDVPPVLDSWTSRVHPEDRARVEGSIRQAIAEGAERWENEYRFRRADGAYAQVYDRGFILHEGDRPTRMIGSMQDVTAKRAAEASLRRSERLSALGTLVAGVAHEINNPLTYMLGNVELSKLALEEVLDGAELSPRTKATLTEVVDEQTKVMHGVEEIAKITRGLRQVARPAEAPRTTVDPRAVVAGVMDVVRSRTKTDVELVTDLRGERLLHANAGEISQVLLNLLFNAADAVQDRPKPRIVVRIRDEKDHVVISVEDNGCGIAPEARSRIFTPFYTTKAEGTGLGLPVSLSIAHDHGGTLEFDTGVGVGTTFRLRLPALAATATAVAK